MKLGNNVYCCQNLGLRNKVAVEISNYILSWVCRELEFISMTAPIDFILKDEIRK